MHVVVIGASGTAGRGVLQACLADAEVTEVRAPTRRPLGVEHPKLRGVVHADFAELVPIAELFAGVDMVCHCLGVSSLQVSGEPEYRRITMDYALAAARALRTGNPDGTFHFISGSGTDVKSRSMWARVKGETEVALQELGLGGAVCWRPAVILDAVPQPSRTLGFRALQLFGRALSVIPSMAVESVAIGEAMLQATREGRRSGVVANREIRELAARYHSSVER